MWMVAEVRDLGDNDPSLVNLCVMCYMIQKLDAVPIIAKINSQVLHNYTAA